MSDNLRDRIAAALSEHVENQLTRFLEDQEEPVNKEYDSKITSEDDKRNLSDWDRLIINKVGDLEEAVELLTTAADLNNDRVTVLTGNGQVHDKHLLLLFEKVGTLTKLVQTLEAGFNTEYKILHDDQKKLTDTLEPQLNSIQNLHDAVQVLTRTVAPYGGMLDAHKDTLDTYGGILDDLLAKTKAHDRDLRAPITDNLRDRIAAVLYERHYRLDGRPSDLTFNDLEPEIRRVYLADADAVIEALSDVLKTSNSHACGVHCPMNRADGEGWGCGQPGCKACY